jgi:hypothetical protein
MTNYPLIVELDPRPWAEPVKNDQAYGLDVEQDLLNHLADEFQKLDPTLPRPYIRGRVIEQLRRSGGLHSDRPLTFVLDRSYDQLMSWMELPVEFIVAVWYERLIVGPAGR